METIIEDMKRVLNDNETRTKEEIDFLLNCWINYLEQTSGRQ